MLNKPKFLIFDYDGVFHPDEYAGMRTTCPDEHSLEIIERRYYDTPDDKGFFNDIREHFSLTQSDDELRMALNAETKEQKEHEVSVMEYAADLSRQFKLVLLSNQISSRSSYLRAHKDFSMFLEIFFSDEVGLAKPSNEIFEFMLKKLNTSPDACIFIDDDVLNIKAANHIRIHAIQFTSLPQLKRDMDLLNSNLEPH